MQVFVLEGLGFGDFEDAWELTGVFSTQEKAIAKAEFIAGDATYTTNTVGNVLYLTTDDSMEMRITPTDVE